jgi:hypothetical protein
VDRAIEVDLSPPVAPRATTSLRVLATAAAIALLAALAWIIASQRTRTVDGVELLGEWFAVGDLPFGLVIAEGAITPRGDGVVRLAVPDAPAETPKNVVPPVEPPKPGEVRPRVDWSKAPTGPPDTPPVEVIVTRFPVVAAKTELDAMFRSGQELRGDFKSIGDMGGRRILDRDELPWGNFEAAYVHEREFEPGLTFRDVMRVNLSREHEPCVLLARWPRGMPASKARVAELLAVLVPRS